MNLRRAGFLIVVAFAAILSGCSPDGALPQAIDTTWSRGLSVGTANLRQPAAIMVDVQV